MTPLNRFANMLPLQNCFLKLIADSPSRQGQLHTAEDMRCKCFNFKTNIRAKELLYSQNDNLITFLNLVNVQTC